VSKALDGLQVAWEGWPAATCSPEAAGRHLGHVPAIGAGVPQDVGRNAREHWRAWHHDLIRDEHTLEIFHHVPNSQPCIFPCATHMVPYDASELFNATVERFFQNPFVKKDRIEDFLASSESMMASLQKK
jgi:hypothetical protein